MSENSDQTLEKIIYLMRTDDSTDAPPDAIRWSKNLFRTRAVKPKQSVVERISAILQVNLSPHQMAFGERSATGAQARQMFFRAGENALDVRITEIDRRFNLRGQILGEDFSGGQVRLGDFETAINELGEFDLTEIEGGNYQLIIRKNDREIVVEQLELK